MGKAILLGILGIFIGWIFYMFLYLVALPMQSRQDLDTTSGCVAMVTGVVFFAVGLMTKSQKPASKDKQDILTNQVHETPFDPTTAASSKNPAFDKLGAYVTELPEVSDEGINNLLQQLQNPMAYIRESALNDVSRTKITDPRIIGAIEILATSDRVDSIQDIAKKTLNTLKNESKSDT